MRYSVLKWGTKMRGQMWYARTCSVLALQKLQALPPALFLPQEQRRKAGANAVATSGKGEPSRILPMVTALIELMTEKPARHCSR